MTDTEKINIEFTKEELIFFDGVIDKQISEISASNPMFDNLLNLLMKIRKSFK